MTYSIGELSRRTGVNVETIRYYDRLKLFGRVPRTNGRRVFEGHDLETLIFVRRCREMLFTIENIKELLPLRATGPCSTVKSIAKEHVEELRTKVRVLSALEKKLSKALALCPGDEGASCTILDLLKAPERHLELA